MLDAEELAEAGIRDAYLGLLPELRKFVPDPNSVEEEVGPSSEYYKVWSGGMKYIIYDGSSDDVFETWARATLVFFRIVNKQLTASDIRFFALYGGNDLQGVFLSANEAEKIRKGTEGPQNWPYEPTMLAPWYGQYHEDGAAMPWYQTVPQ